MPGAWEIMEQRRRRVLWVTISPPDLKVSEEWAVGFRKLRLPPGSDTMFIKGPPYDAARNFGLKRAYDDGYGYLFFNDADTICPPETVEKLIETGRDFIGALYFQRFAPWNPVPAMAEVEGDRIRRRELQAIPYGDMMPVDFVPTGATLYSRRIMEAMLKTYPRPFEWTMDIDKPGGLSEDFDFAIKARQIGFTGYVHTGIIAKHEVLMMVGPRGPEPLSVSMTSGAR